MPLAAIDPQWAPIVGAFATLMGALGLSERRRRRQVRAFAPGDVDRKAAETILTQWKAVLEATEARAKWAEQQERQCEERNAALSQRVDELGEKLRLWEWENARRDWLDKQDRASRRRKE